jgi:hypothetical protein
MCFILGRNNTFKCSSDFCGSLTFKRLGRVFKSDGMVYGKLLLKKRERETENYEIKGALWEIKQVIQVVLKLIKSLCCLNMCIMDFYGAFFRDRLQVKGCMT